VSGDNEGSAGFPAVKVSEVTFTTSPTWTPVKEPMAIALPARKPYAAAAGVTPTVARTSGVAGTGAAPATAPAAALPTDIELIV